MTETLQVTSILIKAGIELVDGCTGHYGAVGALLGWSFTPLDDGWWVRSQDGDEFCVGDDGVIELADWIRSNVSNH